MKLAPIASCETLCETSDFLGEIAESSESSDSADELAMTTAAITITTTPTMFESANNNGEKHVSFDFTTTESSTDPGDDDIILDVPKSILSSTETLTSPQPSPHNLSTSVSSDTLVPGSPCSLSNVPLRSLKPVHLKFGFQRKCVSSPDGTPDTNQLDALALSPATSPKFRCAHSPVRTRSSFPDTVPSPVLVRHHGSPKLPRAPSPISYSFSSPNIITSLAKSRSGKRGSAESDTTYSSMFSPRSSLATGEGSPPSAKAGTVVTSSRASKRRSSSTAAAAAFAAATAGSANPKDHPKGISRFHSAGGGDLKPPNLNKKRESVICTAATMRVINVLRHWVSKHSQDFEYHPELKAGVKDLLEEMVCNTSLLPAEHKAAASVLRVLTTRDESTTNCVELEQLLMHPMAPCKDTFDTLSALDIAEQLTYLDHQIFKAIRSEELLSQAWMKPDKSVKAPHVLLVSKRFNEVSRLVVYEIIHRQNVQERVACIEKWGAIADICRCMHNYNGVLQICAAFVNSSVYRLKKTWEKLSKQQKQMIDKLQTLVTSEGRFKNMREALHRCDPPCIPYLGMYLTDLSFIEEGTPNMTEDALVNFSKMRMVAHVIREIQHFQQTSYRIEHHKRVTNYLLDPSKILDEDETYKASLEIEPRTSRVSIGQTYT